MIKQLLTKQFLKYITIGILGTGLDFLFLYVLVEYFHLYYVASAVFSVAIVIWVSFSFNKYWTFENREKKYFKQFGKYLVSHIVAYLANLAILIVLVEFFGLWYILAKVFATGVSAILNFFLSGKWVFKKFS